MPIVAFISTFLCCLIWSFGFGQTEKLKIREVDEFDVRFFRNENRIAKLKSRKTYDVRGNLLSEINYCTSICGSNCTGDSAVFESKYIYQYDRFNEVVDRKYYSYGASYPWSHTTFKYERNTKGQVLKVTEKGVHQFKLNEFSPQDVSYTTYEYDKKGRLIRSKSSVHSSAYLYDNNENLTYIFVSSSNRRKSSIEYKYDERNNCISFFHRGFEGCGLTMVYWEKKFDDKNRVAYIKSCLLSDQCSETWKDYNDKNQLISRKTDHFEYKYLYNSNGDLAEIQTFYSKNELGHVVYYAFSYF